MIKKTERKEIGTYARSVLSGGAGLAVFLLLLFLGALLCGNVNWLMNDSYPIAKGCLLIGAIVSGAAALRRGENRRFPHALAGEAWLLCTVAAIAAFSMRDGRIGSFLIDLLLLLIGAFAGTILRTNRRLKRRGKREYRT